MADVVYSYPEYPPLPPTVEELVTKIRYKQVPHRPGPRPPLQTLTREKLARLSETECKSLLYRIESQTFHSSLDDFISYLIDNRMSAAPGPSSYCSLPAAPPVTQYYCYSSPPAVSPSSSPSVPPSPSSSSSSASPLKRCSTSQLPPPPPPTTQKNFSPSPTTVKLPMNATYFNIPQPLVPRKLEDDLHDHLITNGGPVSVMGDRMELDSRNDHLATNGGPFAQMKYLWEQLEFRRAFLILNYLGGSKLEDHMTVSRIRWLGGLTMRKFEEEVWSSIGRQCLVDVKHRLKNVDWNPKKPHVYHCTVEHTHDNYRLNITFKGPYVSNMRNFLQTTMGDDHVLLVKFGAHRDRDDMSKCDDNRCREKHASIIQKGIQVGPYHYHFFVFKDGQKEEKKKQEKKKEEFSSGVKCYFIRIEDGNKKFKTIREARSFFMNADTLPNSSNYMARFNLILSKSMKLDLELADVTIRCEPDIPCLDTYGKEVPDKKGKLLIHTDGTGFISEDLARLCPDVSQGRCHDSDIGQIHEVNSDFRLRQPPLLMQLRLFYNGSAIKGTLLVNKKLPHRTIVVRDSMVKVKPYDDLCEKATANSLEIVNTSRQPKPAVLSRNLIMLLNYGGVPWDFFMDLLYKALEDARAVLFKRRTAARAASFHHEKEMIAAGIPFEESYLKFRLPAMMSDEKKKLRGGKIPLPDSYYLMGTADPSGVLKTGEVCIISENGQVSGKVLVYRNPGLHFGDIHILDAVYVKEMDDYVGNAKFGIFFPTHGPRSLADEMAGGDYDGDLFFVSRNQELLDSFKQGKPWESPSLPSNKQSKKSKKVPKDMSDNELETELFRNFWDTRFNPSATMGMAAESWQVTMDNLLTSENAATYKALEKKIFRLIDIYYDALDAPKTGDKVIFPLELKVDRFPHYMEEKIEAARKNRKKILTYHSTSILGAIYDEVQDFEKMDEMPITEIVKLPCFAERAPEHLLEMWTTYYKEYRTDMAKTYSIEEEAKKSEAAEAVNQRYRVKLYGPTGDFYTSGKTREELFEEARAIYQVVYDHAEEKRRYADGDIAEQRKAITKCGFVWKSAGTALCALYISSLGEKQIMCSESAYKEMFG